VYGESAIPKAGQPIERVFLQPDRVRGYPDAVRAILEADIVVAGPGSLFTSVLPNLLVPDIRRAVKASPALRLYVCNVATQPGETDGLDVGQHVAAIQRHLGGGLFPHVLANENLRPSQEFPRDRMVAVKYPPTAGYKVHTADLVDTATPWWHDSHKLAKEILDFYQSSKRRNRMRRAVQPRPLQMQ
jgi:uncharacterized cofD-like protein